MPSYPEHLGRTLVVFGILTVVAGVVLMFARNMRFGTLPGDFSFSGRGWQVWFPLGSSLLLSLVLTLVLNLVLRRR
jgi:Protein of unknown function (DUF2905)